MTPHRTPLRADELDALIAARILPAGTHTAAARAAFNPLPTINPQRTAADAWAKTDHGALADSLGDTSHLAAQITEVRMRRTDGTEAALPTSRPRHALQLVSADQPYRRSAHSITGTTAEAANPAAEIFAVPPTTVSAPQAARRRRAGPMAHHHPREAERIPTWLLALGAAVFVTAIVISSLAPWGWALPL